MIPKTIHYCWFGPNEKPEIVLKCIKSWEKWCPDFKIIEWNEKNYDISKAPLYVRQAYEVKKWAFVTDYARLEIVYNYGGIYLDTDVELLQPLDAFLQYDGFFTFNCSALIATGLGFGCQKQADILAELMADYQTIPFLLDNGTYDMTPCPRRNMNVFLRRGLKQENTFQMIGNMAFFPSEYFSPISFQDMVLRQTENTVAIHWYAATWHTKYAKKMHAKKVRRARIAAKFLDKKASLAPVIGEKNFEKLYLRIRNPKKRTAKEKTVDALKRFVLSVIGKNTYDRLKVFKNKIKYRH
ncbi:MAG: glycosyl transferase [Clostridia bacterium]|nr:glycosyl transferase [Clostridia bacterium]